MHLDLFVFQNFSGAKNAPSTFLFDVPAIHRQDMVKRKNWRKYLEQSISIIRATESATNYKTERPLLFI